jgi:hypothetical protein
LHINIYMIVIFIMNLKNIINKFNLFKDNKKVQFKIHTPKNKKLECFEVFFLNL